MNQENEPWHEDAKLSTAQRKKLKGSTFCGPNRSFPVPDCAHVTAARRLIGRANVGASTKAKILACVSRKAKKLGCGGDTSTDAEIDKIINSESFDETREFIAFMEHVEADKTLDDKKTDSLIDSLAILLDRLRAQRYNIGVSDTRVAAYKARSLNSLIDSILDETSR